MTSTNTTDTTSDLSPRTARRLAKLAISDGLPPPTGLERRLYRALDRLDVRYVPQCSFSPFRVDVFLPNFGIAIEVDGCGWHGCRECGWEDQALYHENKRAYRDRVLLERYHVLCLHIWQHSVPHDEAMYRAVVAALRPHCAELEEAEA